MTIVAFLLAWEVWTDDGPTDLSPTPYVCVVKPAELGEKADAVARRPVATRAVNFIVLGFYYASSLLMPVRKEQYRGRR